MVTVFKAMPIGRLLILAESNDHNASHRPSATEARSSLDTIMGQPLPQGFDK